LKKERVQQLTKSLHHPKNVNSIQSQLFKTPLEWKSKNPMLVQSKFSYTFFTSRNIIST